MEKKYRIGIDVGGTFTHAVAINAFTLEIVATAKVPTSHSAKEGVAQGVIDSMYQLLEVGAIHPDEIMLIAHSTTQATNALLEGDVAPVGIIGMAKGMEKCLASRQTNIGDIELSPGKYLHTFHSFIDLDNSFNEETIKKEVQSLIDKGAKVIIAASAFSVDDQEPEKKIVEIVERDFDVPVTATHQISQLYGLKVRTRTAAINGSMLLKMMETADMTESSIQKAGITAPLMIMRSDGGIMDIDQMRKRPILTMLSGPAAGVAAALMYVRISDGVFLEVGGTSTDITAIKNGKALVKTAQIGQHKIYVRTLDVRTEGVAGGSMIRFDQGKTVAVGPRSAHIAGYKYVSFADDGEKVSDFDKIAPLKGDPDDYLVLKCQSGKGYSLTPTCMSNFLGFIEKGDYSFGNLKFISEAVKKLADSASDKAETLAQHMMHVAVKPVVKVVNGLIEEYELDANLITLTGGGGGAKAIVPYAGKEMELPVEIAENAEVISAIGAALAMVRETIEKTVLNPTSEDILTIKKEATESVLKMGALPQTVEVQIEIDPQQNVLRAIATGSTEFRTDNNLDQDVDWGQLEQKLSDSMQVQPEQLSVGGETSFLKVYQASYLQKKFFGMLKISKNPVRIVDIEGIIRLQLSDARVTKGNKSDFKQNLTKMMQEYTSYGDAGEEIPDVFVLYRRNISDFHGLTSMDQLIALVDSDMDKLTADEEIIAVLDLSHR